VERRRGCSGPGAGEGRSLGAARSSEKREKGDRVESGKGNDDLVPLNAWAQLLMERSGDPCGSGGSGARAQAVWRAETFRLHPTPEQEELLQSVGDAVAKLINMENYRRRQLLFTGKIDLVGGQRGKGAKQGTLRSTER